jgi:FimV-like protein
MFTFPGVIRVAHSPARRIGVFIGVALACGLASAPALGAQRTAAEQAADSLFALQQWSTAASAYKSLTAANAQSGANWVNLGESELQLHHHDAAIAAFAKAIELRYRPFRTKVDQARAYLAKGDDTHALDLVQEVIDGGAGGALRPYILGSSEFARMSGNPRFTAQVAQMKSCTAAPFRQFDFWIGDWEVHGAQGGVAGHNTVTLEQEGCLLVEHWTSSAGQQTGMSFNYYDIRDRKWHQLYIDNSGNAGAFPAMSGTFVDGKIVMLTDDVNNTLSRWTWYLMEPGKVKQMAELSTDHGQTWSVTWNSVYVKKP